MVIGNRRRAAARRITPLGRGNTKLGDLIHTFSVPAPATCPGATPRCRSVCYAQRGFFLLPSHAAAMAAHDRLTRRRDFADVMVRALDRAFARVVRIHVSGDFRDAKAAYDWASVAQRRLGVTFFAYTRSWRVPAIVPALRVLAATPNVHLWLSEDRDTGPSPPLPGTRVAYLVVDADDERRVPAHASLVFRELSHMIVRPEQVKRINSVLVCPHEQSPEMKARVTCSTCRLCFTHKPPMPSPPDAR